MDPEDEYVRHLFKHILELRLIEGDIPQAEFLAVEVLIANASVRSQLIGKANAAVDGQMAFALPSTGELAQARTEGLRG